MARKDSMISVGLIKKNGTINLEMRMWWYLQAQAKAKDMGINEYLRNRFAKEISESKNARKVAR